MNRSMKLLLALSLALNAGILGAVTFGQMRAAPHAPVVASLPDQLHLTPAQRLRWQEIEPGFLNDLAANWRAIKAHRERLVRHIFAPVADRAAISAEQAAIATLQDAQQRRVIAQLLAERDVLDERQRAVLMNLLLDRYARESTEEERLHHD